MTRDDDDDDDNDDDDDDNNNNNNNPLVVQGMTNKQYFVFLYYFYSVTVENNCLYKTSALIHLSQDEQQFKNLLMSNLSLRTMYNDFYIHRLL